MIRRTTRCGLLIILGLILAYAPAGSSGQPPAQGQAATQPAPPEDTQEALEKLLKLRDQMQREQEEKEKAERNGEKAHPTASGRTSASPPRSPRSAPEHPPQPARRPTGAPSSGHPSLEELQAKARASTQRAGSQPPAAASQQVPADFVGPPESLANRLPSAEGPAATPTEAGVSEAPGEPVKPVRRRPAPDEPTEWFSFTDMPWEDVIEHFVQRIGKPLLTTELSGMPTGSLTYVSDRKFTKQEAIDELNLIMHEKGYRFVEDEHHVRIIPINEMKQYVSVKDTYNSVAAFERANPRDMDFVIVYYQVKDRPAQAYVDAFIDALPEPTLLSALPESNQIKIVGLARDVRKFLALKEYVDLTPQDPRALRIFDIKTNAVDIEQRVRAFLRIGGGTAPTIRMVQDPRTGRVTPQPVGGAPASAEGDVQMVADERTNTIIVKATEDKVSEISELIKTLDQKPDIGEFKTEVIPVQHADATEVANLLNQILQQEQGQIRVPNWQLQQQIQNQIRMQRARRGQPTPPQPQPQPVVMQPGVTVAPEDIIAEGIFERAKKTIRLVADPRTNSLIVYANAEGMERVRKMLETIDKPLPDTYQVFELQQAKVADIAGLVTQIAQGMTQTGARAGRTATIVPDEGNNTFHVIAEREEMEKIGKLIRELDVRAREQERHIVELHNLRPSQVAQMVQALLGSGGGGGGVVPAAPPTAPGIRGRIPATPRSGTTGGSSFQVIPLDEAQILIVICSDADWEKIEQTIRMWDERALTNTPQLETFVVQKGNAQSIANTLANFYRTYEHPVLGRSTVAVQAEGDKILVWGVRPALEEISELIKTLDVESVSDKVEILPLVNADASQIAQQVQALFVGRGPRGPLIQAEPLTNSLIVQADKTDLEKIKDFALRMDQKIAAQATEQRFYTMQYAQPQEVANAVQNIFGAPRAGPRGAAASQIRAMAAGAQVIIEAPKDKFAAIETFIKQLDDPKGNEVVMKTVKLPGSDVAQVAQNLSAAVRPLQKPGRPQATFIPDPTTDSIIISAPADLHPKIEELVGTFAAGVEDLAPVIIQTKYADPNQLAQMITAMFRPAGGASRQQQVQATVSNGQLVVQAPKKKLEAIRELVEQVDTPESGGVQVKTYDLKVLSAAQLQLAVQSFLTQVKKNVRPGQLAPGAYAEPTTNTLVVLAPPEVMPMVDGLIAELEQKGPKEGRPQSYVLQNVRAEQIAPNIDAMLKAKVTEREGPRKGIVQTAVFADPPSNRLFVFAPEDYQELAASLIKMVDAEVPVGDIVHIIPLEHGDAQQLAQSLNQLIAANRAGSGGPGARSGTANVRVTADAGSNSILLGGLPKDIAEVEKWIAELETSSVRVPELQTFRLQYASVSQVEETLKSIFGTSRNPQEAVTVTADEYSGKLIVTANKRKMRQVEMYIKELDRPPTQEEQELVDGGRQVYLVEINRGDAIDIAFNVRGAFPDEKHGGPLIDYDYFGQYLIVKCRPSEYPKIEKVIRQFERLARVETTVRTYKPKGDVDALVTYLKARGENVVFERATEKPRQETLIEYVRDENDLPPGRKGKEKEKEQGEPEDRGALRFRPDSSSTQALLDEIRAELSGGRPSPAQVPAFRLVAYTPQTEPGTSPSDPPPVGGGNADAAAEVKPGPEEPLTVPSPFPKQPVRIIQQPDGTLLIEGPREQVDDVTRAIDIITEDLAVGEVIRIFKFRYGDVNAAAEILTMMFDVQQRQIVIQPPQQPQRGQQPGRPGEEGREGREQPGLLDQLRGMVGGQPAGDRKKGTGQMRVATDPGHNYLIVKCNETLLPEIRQLLRELDIPPGEVQVKVFQLKNLRAEETAENIRDVLGISKIQQRRTGGLAPLPRGRAGGPQQQQQQLIEMLQAQLVSVPGVEGGAKVERVEIVPNSVTNSLLVSAPPEVMGLIEKVIRELENLEGRDIVGIHHYPLQNARADDLVPLLSEIFSGTGGAGAGGGAGRGPRGAAGGGGSPAALGPVTISADPRSNTIIFMCENKDVELVENQIRRLDIAGPIAEAELYACRYGDAEAIAAAVEAIFAPGTGRAGRGPRGEGGTSAADVRIAADPATNTILVWGPLDKRDLIFARIEQLDQLNQRDIREIPVMHADPEKLAATLSEVFIGGGSGTQPGQRGGARRVRPTGGAGGAGGGPTVVGSGHILILGDKAAKKLLVRAPDEIFYQIKDLVATLDHPSQDMQLKRFQLRYADADAVVESVKQAMTEYLQLAKTFGAETDLDPFTAVPDPRTNSVTVVGSDRTFAFVNQVLAAVDVPTPPEQRKEFRIFMLEKADAAGVADAINSYASGGAGAAGGGRAGRRGGGGAPGGATGLPRMLDVYAVAEEATNSVMVFGRADDIDLVEAAVINQLEDSLSEHYRIETVSVQNVPPSQIVNFISQFMGERPAGGTGGQAGRGRAAGQQTGPQIVPNDSAKTLVVRGTKREIDQVRDLVERFDDVELVQATIKVIEIPYGQDAVRLSKEVERIINSNEEQLASLTGRVARRVVVGADEYTNTLIVAGDPTLFGQAETIVNQLAEVRTGAYVTRVIELKNLSAQDAEQLINEIQKRKVGGGGGTVRPVGGPGTPSVGQPSRGGQQTPSTPPARQPSGAGRRQSTPPRQPSGGGQPKPQPSRQPGGGGGSPSGGKSSLPKPAEMDPASSSTWMGDSWLRAVPCLATAQVWPGLGLLAAQQEQPPEQPPTESHRRKAQTRPRPVTTRPTTQPANEATEKPTAPAPAPQHQRPPQETEEEADRGEAVALEPASEPAFMVQGLTGVSGALRGEVTASAVDSQRIIIGGDEQDVAFIEQILLMMEHSATPALVEVFALQNAKATALAPIIDKAVKAQIEARTGKPGPQDRFSINAEARSNSLIVSAAQPVMDRIRELVEKLDIERAGAVTDVRMISLDHVRASEAVTLLRPTIEKLNKMREVPAESQASIDADDRSNSVLIIGTEKDLEEIQRLIKAIDVEITSEVAKKSFVAADVILIQLKNGSAEDIAKTLSDMIKAEQEAAAAGVGKKEAGKPFVKKLRLRLADGRELPELDLERPIRVIAEKGTNSLIIFSSKDNNEALTAIVEVFDTLPVGADTDVKAFALRHAQAEEVAKLLTDIFKDKSYLNRPSEGEAKGLTKGVMPPVPPGVAAKGLPYPLVVQHDKRSNVVVVIGRKDAVLLAGGLINELDRPTVELGMKSYVVQLKNAQAAQIQDKLKKLLDDRAKALGTDKNAARDSAVIYADERSNRLIVLATEEVYDMVEDLVLQLDAAEKYNVVDVRYRTLAHADAVKLKNMLEETFKNRADAEKKTNKESADVLNVLADPRSNSLLLTGTRDYLEEAERLIAQLDQQFDGTVVFKARKIRLNSAPNVAALLTEMIEKALTQKDSKLSGTPIHVTADPVSGSLLLAASREDMEVIERWADILDRPSEVGRMTRIIPLRRTAAEEVSKSVENIFKKQGGTKGGGEIDLTVAADKTTNSVVVFGPPALLPDVEDFVRKLDGTEPTKGAVVRIFKLQQADAEKAGELLQRILELRGGTVGGTGGGGGGSTKEADKQVMLIFQRDHPEVGLETLKAMRSEIVVISDTRTNSLVVTAPAESMPLMESLVMAVDVPPEDAKVRVFRLRNADAEQMVKMLEALFERKTTTGGRGGGEQPERVLALGEGIGAEGGRQEVAFTTDIRTNSVIAAGTPGYLNLVEQLIYELDTVPIRDRETWVYAPKSVPAENLAPTLKEFSDAEQARLEKIGKDVSIGVKQERQITAIANKDANRLILDVDPRFRQEVMEVLHDLDQPPPQVMIQVLIVEVTMDNKLELGVEFAFQDLQYAKAGVSDTTTFDFVGGTDIGAAGSGFGGFTFTITGADFNFLFRTLQSEGNLNVLSRPQIVAMDNQEARIDISDDVPYVTGTQTSSTGQISTSVGREKVGIILKVTPQINPDGFVRMKIYQKVSDQTGSTVDVGPGVTAPIFFTREAETTTVVKDHETVVLGGLITSRVENREVKVPILGDIPGLGLLFRTQTDTTNRKELLVVLTPHVIRTVDDYRELSLAERDTLEAIPNDVLTDPLMQGLRVSPDDLPALEARERSRRGPAQPPGPKSAPPQAEEEYGPMRPALRPEPAPPDDDSYNVPLSLKPGGSTWGAHLPAR